MKLLVLLSVPAIVGFCSWALNWAFAFAPLRRMAYAYHWQMAFGLVFVVMIWIGPIASGVAAMAIHKSSSKLPGRRPLYLLNVAWGIVSLALLTHFLLDHML